MVGAPAKGSNMDQPFIPTSYVINYAIRAANRNKNYHRLSPSSAQRSDPPGPRRNKSCPQSSNYRAPVTCVVFRS